MKINAKEMKWIRTPKQYEVTEDRVEIITEPHTRSLAENLLSF